ncbi:MAG: hypothetical protein IJ218_05365 [Alphaproteobacteria bacterium]|nr:hypothetical protein [Alphaproteobacteria bacterium]
MIRKFLICLGCAGALFLMACHDENSVAELSAQEVYFFFQEGCPHCHTAAEYIKEKHPELKVRSLDIAMPGNRRLFNQAARGYRLGMNVGTPLICFGNDYIMGWGADAPAKFEKYAKKYE